MKIAITTILLSCILNSLVGQNIVKETFYSKEYKDTISYRVWIPDGYTIAKKYPVIYTVEDTEDALLAGSINFYKNTIPNSIVVGVIHGREFINYDFSTGLADEKGLGFFNSLVKEIIPGIEKKYSTSKFRAFMGHSYSSTYANYLFLHQPGIFSGYMLFAPERWWEDETKPTFELDEKTIQFYNTHPTFYFLASGNKDISRRKKFAAEIAEKVKQLDSTQFSFQFLRIEDADHSSIVPKAMPAGLYQIFKPFYIYNTIEKVPDFLEFFNKTKSQLSDIYGMTLEKNNPNTVTFGRLAVASKDKKAMDAVIDYFVNDKMIGLDYFNLAYGTYSMGYNEKSLELTEQSIRKSKKDELNTPQGLTNLTNAYFHLAFRIYKDDNVKAWESLQRAVNDKDVRDSLTIRYYIGRLSADRSYKSKEGLQQLLYYAQKNSKADVNRGITLEKVYFYTGKNYYLLNDKKNARIYLQKALAENSNNKETKELLDKLDSK